MRKSRRFMALVALVAAFGTFSSACFGTFALTRKVYAFNQGVGDKFLQSVVMWAFLLIPVYSVVLTIDLVLNFIEFWTGANPLAMRADETRSQDFEMDGRVLRMTLMDRGQRLMVGEVVDGALVNVRYFGGVNERGESTVTDGSGELVASAREELGGIVVEDASGKTLLNVAPELVAEAQLRAEVSPALVATAAY